MRHCKLISVALLKGKEEVGGNERGREPERGREEKVLGKGSGRGGGEEREGWGRRWKKCMGKEGRN
jgi:hypothetical protein